MLGRALGSLGLSVVLVCVSSGARAADPPTASFPPMEEQPAASAPAGPPPTGTASFPLPAPVFTQPPPAAMPLAPAAPLPAASPFPPVPPSPAAPVATAPVAQPYFRPPAPVLGATPRAPESDRPTTSDERDADASEAWMLSAEGITRAPVDLGVQAGLETPFGLRLFGGVGWVPGAYSGMVSGIAASFSGSGQVQAVLDNVQFSGNTWHVQAGLRPFRNVGVYFDVGYTHVSLSGLLDVSNVSVPGLPTLSGGYDMSSSLDMWQFELGYQAQVAQRLVLAAGLGAMGTMGSQTTITALGGAPSGPEVEEAAGQVDAAFESYGIVPTLTLRLGLDVI